MTFKDGKDIKERLFMAELDFPTLYGKLHDHYKHTSYRKGYYMGT